MQLTALRISVVQPALRLHDVIVERCTWRWRAAGRQALANAAHAVQSGATCVLVVVCWEWIPLCKCIRKLHVFCTYCMFSVIANWPEWCIEFSAAILLWFSSEEVHVVFFGYFDCFSRVSTQLSNQPKIDVALPVRKYYIRWLAVGDRLQGNLVRVLTTCDEFVMAAFRFPT